MTSLNSLPVTAAATQPRGLIRLGGQIVDGWHSFSVVSNSNYEADTFHVVYSVPALPAAFGPKWFGAQAEIFAEILAGYPSHPNAPMASQLSSLIYGRVDSIDYNPVTQMLAISGRDLTAAFIDNKLAASYVNSKASDVVVALADSHGLQPAVTPTSDY